jgi:hypothetical protein
MTPRRARIALLACAALLALPAQGALAPQPAARPDALGKRCQAAQRRVERQKQVLAELDARLAKDTEARGRCEGKRACDRADRALKAHAARRSRYEHQLAQYEADAARYCAAP